MLVLIVCSLKANHNRRKKRDAGKNATPGLWITPQPSAALPATPNIRSMTKSIPNKQENQSPTISEQHFWWRAGLYLPSNHLIPIAKPFPLSFFLGKLCGSATVGCCRTEHVSRTISGSDKLCDELVGWLTVKSFCGFLLL
jgi:hypothetical protein